MFTLIAVIAIVFIVMAGAITVPNRSLLKPVENPGKQRGGVAKEAFQVRGIPVRVAATGTNGPKVAMIERTDGANKNRGYCGINLAGPIDLGAVLDEEAVGVVDDVIIDGYAGVTPGLPVFVDSTAVPVPVGTFSYLTHTDPADGTLPIGQGWTTTKIRFFAAR
jgi:hypothetical protein